MTDYVISGEQYGELLRLSLAHCVVCKSGELYCECCELAEAVLLLDPDMAARLDALDVYGTYREGTTDESDDPNLREGDGLRAFWVRDEGGGRHEETPVLE